MYSIILRKLYVCQKSLNRIYIMTQQISHCFFIFARKENTSGILTYKAMLFEYVPMLTLMFYFPLPPYCYHKVTLVFLKRELCWRCYVLPFTMRWSFLTGLVGKCWWLTDIEKILHLNINFDKFLSDILKLSSITYKPS